MAPHRPNYVSAITEVHQSVGPKGVHGCVALEFERSHDFKFVSDVEWPAGDNYDQVIEAAIRQALSESKQPHAFVCRLTEIRWHEVDSCASGFARAARHATLAAFAP